MARSKKIRGLSDILTYFRRNETPIFFISPTAFNLLGLEKFVNRFFHINYFDSFDSNHPRVFVPSEKSHAEFESMEDVCNYMLQHKEVIDKIRKAGHGPARVLFVMLDEKTEEICKQLPEYPTGLAEFVFNGMGSIDIGMQPVPEFGHLCSNGS